MNGVLQDWLVEALWLEGISDLGLANEYLARAFLPAVNRRFQRRGDPKRGGDNCAGDTARSWRVASPADARAGYRVADVHQPATHRGRIETVPGNESFSSTEKRSP